MSIMCVMVQLQTLIYEDSAISSALASWLGELLYASFFQGRRWLWVAMCFSVVNGEVPILKSKVSLLLYSPGFDKTGWV